MRKILYGAVLFTIIFGVWAEIMLATKKPPAIEKWEAANRSFRMEHKEPRTGWTNFSADVKIGKEWTPLYSEPDAMGFRNGLAIYLPGGMIATIDMKIDYESRGDKALWTLVTLDDEIVSSIGALRSHDLEDRRILKCNKPINQICELSVKARSDGDATVFASSHMFATEIKPQ